MIAALRLLVAVVAVLVLAFVWALYQTPVMGLMMSEVGFCQ